MVSPFSQGLGKILLIMFVGNCNDIELSHSRPSRTGSGQLQSAQSSTHQEEDSDATSNATSNASIHGSSEDLYRT